jgi:hypothetical protein
MDDREDALNLLCSAAEGENQVNGEPSLVVVVKRREGYDGVFFFVFSVMTDIIILFGHRLDRHKEVALTHILPFSLLYFAHCTSVNTYGC